MSAETTAEVVQTPVKLGRLVLAPDHREGSFMSHGVDCPFVFTVDGRMGMTFVGWDGIGYQTGLTWRLHDDEWSPPQLVLPREPTSAHRRFNSALTSIVRDEELLGSGELKRIDGYFYGTFHAYPAPGYEEGPAVIGFVRSRDLVEWEECGGVLRPEDGGAWERGGLYKSWLTHDGEQFEVFYNAKNVESGDWTEQTGAAVSMDLVDWARVDSEPLLPAGGSGDFDERFASDPCVLRFRDDWIMFYFGLSRDGHARESWAFSRDRRHWEKSGDILIDVGALGTVDDKYAHKPSVIHRAGVLEHYYCAVQAVSPFTVGTTPLDEIRGISVARSSQPNFDHPSDAGVTG